MAEMIELKEQEERVILVAVSTGEDDDTAASVDELEELASTAGAVTVGKVIQNRENVHPGTYLGKGKIEEVKELLWELDATGIICDDELSPAQLKNLEDAMDTKVMDRTMVILDIFASRARTREGKIQVELAQLRYRAVRLVGLRNSLSRLGGGIGTRGPGEKKLEVDRRLIHERISQLKSELEDVKRHREVVRKKRENGGALTAAIVGYTNAGKSTLLNRLTQAGILAEDKLFATLDPTTRRLRFPEEHELVLADTVGFIRNLPKELTEAFQATLEELEAADLLLHVADASHPELDRQIAAVDGILADMELNEVPRVLILNKWDRLEDEMRDILRDRWPDALPISAETRDGLNALSRCIENTIHWETTANIEITGPMPKVY